MKFSRKIFFLVFLPCTAALFITGCPSSNYLDWVPLDYCVKGPMSQINLCAGLETIVDKRPTADNTMLSASNGTNEGEVSQQGVNRSTVETGLIMPSSGTRMPSAQTLHSLYYEGLTTRPFLGSTDETLTNELYYNVIRTGLFRSVERWFDKTSVDIILLPELNEFKTTEKEYPLVKVLWPFCLLGVPTGAKTVDIQLGIHVLQASSGKEIVTYIEERHVKKYVGLFYKRENLADKVICEIENALFQRLIRDKDKLYTDVRQ